MRERQHRYIPGSYLAVCDECGRVYHIEEMRWRWDNSLVCKQDWEPRHPQLDVKARRDRMRVPHPRPMSTCSNDLEMLDTLVMLDDLNMGPRCFVANPITPEDL